MKLSVTYLPSTRNSASPYRLLDELGQEVTWANRFLDAKRLLGRSPRSLRAYAFDLLHFARWALQDPPRQLADLTEDVLQEYVRQQLDHQPPPAAPTINRRLAVIRALWRFHFAYQCLPCCYTAIPS